MAMRRLLALLTVAVGVTGSVPVRAHSCATPVEIPLGETVTYACTYFNLVGSAQRQATLVFPMTVHGADGSAVEFTGENADDTHPAQLVYAGISPPSGGEGGGLPGATAGMLPAAIATIGAATLWRRRQTPRHPPGPGRPTQDARPPQDVRPPQEVRRQAALTRWRRWDSNPRPSGCKPDALAN